MSDQPLSAAAKKNKKKQQKKAAAAAKNAPQQDDQSDLIGLKETLKERLQQAKDAKDHVTAGKLREQIWIVNDIIAGIRTDMPEEEIRAVLEGLPLPELETKEKPAAPSSASAPSGDGGVTGSGLTDSEREIKKLKKKLKQIEDIKEKKAKGVKLEKNQLDKIETEDAILKEIEELEAALATAMANLKL